MRTSGPRAAGRGTLPGDTARADGLIRGSLNQMRRRQSKYVPGRPVLPLARSYNDR